MQKLLLPADQAETHSVIAGHLPDPQMVRELAPAPHARFKSKIEGKNSQVHPALVPVPSGRDRQS
jgi:hypothetical protein